MLQTAPAVFAVENEYQIMVPVEKECLFWVRVEDKEFYDESNGILRSRSMLHRTHVPLELLDRTKEYTVCVRPLIERKPYFTTTEPVQEFTFSFRPLPKEDIRIYHISDAHNRITQPVAAVETFGPIDLLILNGDILDHSGDPSKFSNIYEICSRITHGQIPVVFSRGNHDMRGNFAEAFADYTPNHCGNTYYSFRLGALWGVVLDCGEDKADTHEEYGHTVSCHEFRCRQTRFLKELTQKDDYKQAKYRIAVVHHPFTTRMEPPFNIEEDIYTQWAACLKVFDLSVMLSGHLHSMAVFEQGSAEDNFGQTCPVVVSGLPAKNYWAGCGVTLGEQITATFTDSDGKILSKHTL